MKNTRSGVMHVTAGCKVCHGSKAHWSGEDALALALGHHNATGHPTWGTVTVKVIYGDEGAEASDQQSGADHSDGSTKH